VNSVRCRAVIDRTATIRGQRLIRWLEPFQRCFGHRAQRLALQTYVHGVFSDSDRKSMQAMLARVTDPITYQGLQHFITHAVWDADRILDRRDITSLSLVHSPVDQEPKTDTLHRSE
jgi:SRSO17 transposase